VYKGFEGEMKRWRVYGDRGVRLPNRKSGGHCEHGWEMEDLLEVLVRS